MYISCLNKQVENQDKQSFRSSRPASIDKPCKMWNNSEKINVRLEDLKEGRELDNEADGHQVSKSLSQYQLKIVTL